MVRMKWAKGLTRAHWTVLLVAWLGWVFDIMDTALFNFAKVPMLKEMLGGDAAYKAMGPQIEGNIQALFLIGWAVGGLVFGILADQWGRTRTLVLTILIYSVLTGLTALCRTPEQVAVLRFLTALGIGGEWAAGAALVAESFPDRARGPAAALLQSAAAFGPWLASVANLSIPTNQWRLLFLIGVLPAVLCAVIRVLVPEPATAARLRRGGSWAAPLKELFGAARWRRHAIVAMVLGIVGVTGAGIIPFWLPNLVNEAAAQLGDDVRQRFTSYNTFTIHIGTLMGVFAFPFIAERIGRRRAFALFFVLAPLATWMALGTEPSLDRLLWLLPIATFFSIGLSAGFVLYFPELFPPRFRATGAGLAYNVGRVASAPMPALIGAVIGATQGNVAYGILIASAIYVIGLAALPFAPETKGQPLPESDPAEPTPTQS